MNFRRTNSGLSNFCLFVDAEAVVFVEGGSSATREDVENGHFSSRSSDIRFWQMLFNIYFPDKKFQFRSIGSKETVKNIANDIQAGNISNVIVAMDRDFDHLNGRIIDSNDVLYTKGYSWENDSWCEITMVETFCALSGACKNNVNDEARYIKESLSKFASRVRGAVLIDAILSQYSYSLFDRKSPNRYIQILANGEPAINMSQLKNSLLVARQYTGKPIIRKSSLNICKFRDCFGHLLAEFGYRVLTFLLEKTGKLPKIPKEYAASMIVEKFAQAFMAGMLGELKKHYDIEFLKVTA